MRNFLCALGQTLKRFKRAGRHGHQRKRHGESSAPSASRAFRLHLASVHFDPMPNNRKPKTEPAMQSRKGAVGLPEAVEDVRQKLIRDAFAVVSHRYAGG